MSLGFRGYEEEIEGEAGALREMQAKVEKEMGSVQGFCSNFNIFDFNLFYFFR